MVLSSGQLPLRLLPHPQHTHTHTPRSRRYGGRMTTAFQTIVREEGVAGLYRGIAANYLKAVPAVATSFLLYAEISALLGNDKSGHD